MIDVLTVWRVLFVAAFIAGGLWVFLYLLRLAIRDTFTPPRRATFSGTVESLEASEDSGGQILRLRGSRSPIDRIAPSLSGMFGTGSFISDQSQQTLITILLTASTVYVTWNRKDYLSEHRTAYLPLPGGAQAGLALLHRPDVGVVMVDAVPIPIPDDEQWIAQIVRFP